MTHKPVILTNAFRRPRSIYSRKGVSVCDKTYVYACIEEIITVITDKLNATPLITPVIADKESLAHILDNVDGILLPGGYSNIHPLFYGEADNGLNFPDCDKNHDQTDIILITEAIKRNIPILGICRGMQAMNVALSGTLTYIDHHNKEENFTSDSKYPLFINHDASCAVDGMSTEPQYMHDINIKPDSKLAEILNQAQTCSTNTMHEQTIGKLGNDLNIDATAPDGVVEAISLTNHKFFLGLQWHPEAQPNTELSEKIWRAFRGSMV